MGWATDQANRIKQAEAVQRERRQWQMHAHSMIVEAKPSMVRDLFDQIERDVTEFNTAMQDSLKVRRDGGGESLLVLKDAYPRTNLEVRADAWFRTDTRTNTSIGDKDHGAIKYHADETGNVYFVVNDTRHDYASLSQYLLRPVFALFDPDSQFRV